MKGSRSELDDDLDPAILYVISFTLFSNIYKIVYTIKLWLTLLKKYHNQNLNFDYFSKKSSELDLTHPFKTILISNICDKKKDKQVYRKVKKIGMKSIIGSAQLAWFRINDNTLFWIRVGFKYALDPDQIRKSVSGSSTRPVYNLWDTSSSYIFCIRDGFN